MVSISHFVKGLMNLTNGIKETVDKIDNNGDAGKKVGKFFSSLLGDIWQDVLDPEGYEQNQKAQKIADEIDQLTIENLELEIAQLKKSGEKTAAEILEENKNKILDSISQMTTKLANAREQYSSQLTQLQQELNYRNPFSKGYSHAKTKITEAAKQIQQNLTNEADLIKQQAAIAKADTQATLDSLIKPTTASSENKTVVTENSIINGGTQNVQ